MIVLMVNYGDKKVNLSILFRLWLSEMVCKGGVPWILTHARRAANRPIGAASISTPDMPKKTSAKDKGADSASLDDEQAPALPPQNYTVKNDSKGNKSSFFKPPQKLEDGRVGYPLSPLIPVKGEEIGSRGNPPGNTAAKRPGNQWNSIPQSNQSQILSSLNSLPANNDGVGRPRQSRDGDSDSLLDGSVDFSLPPAAENQNRTSGRSTSIGDTQAGGASDPATVADLKTPASDPLPSTAANNDQGKLLPKTPAGDIDTAVKAGVGNQANQQGLTTPLKSDQPSVPQATGANKDTTAQQPSPSQESGVIFRNIAKIHKDRTEYVFNIEIQGSAQKEKSNNSATKAAGDADASANAGVADQPAQSGEAPVRPTLDPEYSTAKPLAEPIYAELPPPPAPSSAPGPSGLQSKTNAKPVANKAQADVAGRNATDALPPTPDMFAQTGEAPARTTPDPVYATVNKKKGNVVTPKSTETLPATPDMLAQTGEAPVRAMQDPVYGTVKRLDPIYEELPHAAEPSALQNNTDGKSVANTEQGNQAGSKSTDPLPATSDVSGKPETTPDTEGVAAKQLGDPIYAELPLLPSPKPAPSPGGVQKKTDDASPLPPRSLTAGEAASLADRQAAASTSAQSETGQIKDAKTSSIWKKLFNRNQKNTEETQLPIDTASADVETRDQNTQEGAGKAKKPLFKTLRNIFTGKSKKANQDSVVSEEALNSKSKAEPEDNASSPDDLNQPPELPARKSNQEQANQTKKNQPEPDEVAKRLINYYGPKAEFFLNGSKTQPADLSAGEIMSIGLYSKFEYAEMNIKLRNAKSLLTDTENALDQGLQSGLKKLSTDEVIKTYRGGVMPGKEQPGEGKIFTDHGYLSTSTDYEVAKNYKAGDEKLLMLFGKSGGDISGLSAFPGEKEVLYPKNTKFNQLFVAPDGVTVIAEEDGLPKTSGKKYEQDLNEQPKTSNKNDQDMDLAQRRKSVLDLPSSRQPLTPEGDAANSDSTPRTADSTSDTPAPEQAATSAASDSDDQDKAGSSNTQKPQTSKPEPDTAEGGAGQAAGEDLASRVGQSKDKVADKPSPALINDAEAMRNLRSGFDDNRVWQEINKTPEQRAAFDAYMKRTYASENIEAANAIDQLKTKTPTLDELRKFYNNFVSDKADQQINIDAESRALLKNGLESNDLNGALAGLRSIQKDLFTNLRGSYLDFAKTLPAKKAPELPTDLVKHKQPTEPQSSTANNPADAMSGLRTGFEKSQMWQDINKTPEQRAAFDAYLKRTFANENIDAARAIEQMQQGGKLPTVDELRKFYQDFVSDQSEQQINVSGNSHDALKSSLEKNDLHGALDGLGKIQKELLGNLKGSYNDFVKTQPLAKPSGSDLITAGAEGESQSRSNLADKMKMPFDGEEKAKVLENAKKTGQEVLKDAGLSAGELEAIKWYAGSGYSTLNPMLREGEAPTHFVKTYHDDMLTGLDKLPDHQGDLYRALVPKGDLSELAKKLKPGQVIGDKAFVSTTESPDLAKSFRGGKDTVVIGIQNGKGKSIAGFGPYHDQAEVLVKPNTYMKVVSAELTDRNLFVVVEQMDGPPSDTEKASAINVYDGEKLHGPSGRTEQAAKKANPVQRLLQKLGLGKKAAPSDPDAGTSQPETPDASDKPSKTNTSRFFKPPQKLEDGRVGYPLSPIIPVKGEEIGSRGAVSPSSKKSVSVADPAVTPPADLPLVPAGGNADAPLPQRKGSADSQESSQRKSSTDSQSSNQSKSGRRYKNAEHSSKPAWGGKQPALPTPNQKLTKKQVAKDFIVESHISALEQASIDGNFAATFRAAGAATLDALDKGAGAKGHDVLEKTIKSSSVLKAYPDNGQAILEMIRAAGIEGYVGHWDQKTGELIGIYMTKNSPGSKREIYPIDVKNLESSLENLKQRPDWTTLPLTGDYDMHDMIVYGGAGRPKTPLVGSKEERAVIDRINAEVEKVAPERPFADEEHNVVRHGPQVNFPSYMLSHEAQTVNKNGGFLGAVANAGEFPLAAVDRGTWFIINDIFQLDAFYKNTGAVMKENWNPNSQHGYREVPGKPGLVKFLRSYSAPAGDAAAKSKLNDDAPLPRSKSENALETEKPTSPMTGKKDEAASAGETPLSAELENAEQDVKKSR